MDGLVFRDEHGAIWSMRGADAYAILALLMRGEDITPKLREARADGANTIRVFGEINWRDDTTGELVYPEIADPLSSPGYYAAVEKLFNLAAEYGLRVEFTVLTYPDSTERMNQKLQRIYDVVG